MRENVAFQGKGELTRFVHERYPGRGCAIALEFKKFYMDEWTGAPDPAELEAMRGFIDATAEAAAEACCDEGAAAAWSATRRPFEAEFGPTGALRQDFGGTAGSMSTAPLPFIVLHRADPEAGDQPRPRASP